MTRKMFSRELKHKAVELVTKRGVSAVEADGSAACPRNGKLNPEQEKLRSLPPKELLHHSDQRSQYISEPFQRLMADRGITCSMSRSGNVWDDAAVESFFSSLKTERVRQKIYGTKKQTRADVFDYIERFYTPKRRHSTIGYLSPITFEERAMKAKVAVREIGSRPVVRGGPDFSTSFPPG